MVGDLDALGHGLPAQKVDQTVGLGAEGHTFDAVAAGGHSAGDIGKDLIRQTDAALFVLDRHKLLPFFRCV